MSTREQQLEWVQRYSDGVASADEVAHLADALRNDAALRAEFLDYVHLDSALGAMAASMEVTVGASAGMHRSPAPRGNGLRFGTWLGMVAAAACICVMATTWYRADRVAVEVEQSEGTRLHQAGQRLALRNINLPEGALTLRVAESGVQLKLSGPVEARFETPMRMRVVHGSVSADVGPNGVGFTIVTDAGEVVDLGTSFGVEAERGGESRVAVFSGQVKVRQGRAREGNAFTTLSEGEAVRFSAVAGLRRWEQVAMAAEAAGVLTRARTATLATVRDNLGEGALHPFYGVVAGGMTPGSLAFTDKPNPRWAPHPTDSVPVWLNGADLVRTYHQFRHRRGYELALTLREPATVFVLMDARQVPPAWLTERFTNTGARVAVGPWQQGMRSEPDTEIRSDGLPYLPFAVWRCDAGPGEFMLGAPRDAETNRTALMYGVAVKGRAAKSGGSLP